VNNFLQSQELYGSLENSGTNVYNAYNFMNWMVHKINVNLKLWHVSKDF